jgi:hypothetical protein
MARPKAAGSQIHQRMDGGLSVAGLGMRRSLPSGIALCRAFGQHGRRAGSGTEIRLKRAASGRLPGTGGAPAAAGYRPESLNVLFGQEQR